MIFAMTAKAWLIVFILLHLNHFYASGSETDDTTCDGSYIFRCYPDYDASRDCATYYFVDGKDHDIVSDLKISMAPMNFYGTPDKLNEASEMYRLDNVLWMVDSGNPQSCIDTDTLIDELASQNHLFRRVSPFYMVPVGSGGEITFNFLVNMVVQIADFLPFKIGLSLGCPTHISKNGFHGIIGNDILQHVPHSYQVHHKITFFNFNANENRNFLVLSDFGSKSSQSNKYYRPTNDVRKIVDIYALIKQYVKPEARDIFIVDQEFWNFKGDIVELRKDFIRLSSILMVLKGKEVLMSTDRKKMRFGKDLSSFEVVVALGAAVGTFSVAIDGEADNILVDHHYEILSRKDPESTSRLPNIEYPQLNETDDGSDLL